MDEVRALAAEDEEVERELAALDALIALGDEWRRTHPRQPDEMTAEETVRADRDGRDAEKWERSFGRANDELERDDDAEVEP